MIDFKTPEEACPWRWDRLHKAHAEEYMIFVVYCIVYLFNCFSCPPALCDIFHTPLDDIACLC